MEDQKNLGFNNYILLEFGGEEESDEFDEVSQISADIISNLPDENFYEAKHKVLAALKQEHVDRVTEQQLQVLAQRLKEDKDLLKDLKGCPLGKKLKEFLDKNPEFRPPLKDAEEDVIKRSKKQIINDDSTQTSEFAKE